MQVIKGFRTEKLVRGLFLIIQGRRNEMEGLEQKIIAIIRGIGTEDIEKTIQALYKGGIRAMEITLNHNGEDRIQESLDMIQMTRQKFHGEISLGAGTVLSAREVELAVNAGAEYIISPNVDKNVIKRTKEMGKISMPGAFTPTEVMKAYQLGADIVKVFPAGNMGTDYVRALRGPLGFIPLAAVGGVNLDNAKILLEAGYQMLGIGGNLVSRRLIKEQRFDELAGLARQFALAVGGKER